MSATPRPPAVTMACVFVGFSAFLMLIELVGALTSWGTIEMQEALQPSLATLQDRGLDVTMGELLRVLRWVGLACVLLLVAGLVFAIYAARGDQMSRIGATVIAVIVGLLVVPFGLLGFVQAIFLLIAATTLWLPDARAWYAAQRKPAGDPHSADIPAPTSAPIDEAVDDTSASTNPWAAPPTQSAPTIEAPTPSPPPTDRPTAVLIAGLVTVLGSSLVAGLSALYLVIYGVAREEYVRIAQDGPFADWYTAAELDDAMRAAFWGCLVILPLAGAGLAAGISLLARLKVGRAATLAVSWVTAAVGVVLVPFGLLATGAAIAVIVLLNRDESRAWTADAR